MATIPPCPPHLLQRLLAWVRQHPLADGRAVPVCLWGERGIGKTQMVARFAHARGIDLATYHPAHDSGRDTMLGQAYLDPDVGRTRIAPPDFLPQKANGTLAPAGVFLIDEINRASRDVLAGLLELVGEGRISQSAYQLPRGWQIVCAANPPGGDYHVQDLDPALIDRMLHVAVAFDSTSWAAWAVDKGIEEDVVRFVSRSPGIVHGGRGTLPSEISPAPTPRALELFASLYEPGMPADLLALIAPGLLGEEAASSFIAGPLGAERPLSGRQMERGLWRRYFPRWIRSNPKAIAESLDAFVGHLEGRPRDEVLAGEIRRMRHELPEEILAAFDSALARNSPDWAELVARPAR